MYIYLFIRHFFIHGKTVDKLVHNSQLSVKCLPCVILFQLNQKTIQMFNMVPHPQFATEFEQIVLQCQQMKQDYPVSFDS
jgi:hypothetical protein